MYETESDLQEARVWVPQNQICSHDCWCISPVISSRQVFHARAPEELRESALDNEPLLQGELCPVRWISVLQTLIW